MPACKDCGKEYTNQNSLTRHAHKHQKSASHCCEHCGVAFYRRDLLTRHMRLHRKRSADPVQSCELDPATPSSRKRCHTACTRCRDRRTKCDGRRPCTACLTSSLDCQYSGHSSRISHQAIDLTEQDLTLAFQTFDRLSPPPSLQASIPEEDDHLIGQEDTNVHDNLHGPGPSNINDETSMLETNLDTNTVPPPMDGDLMYGMDFSWMNGNEYIAWPELHENLFLQDEMYSTSPHTSLPLGSFNQHLDLIPSLINPNSEAPLPSRCPTNAETVTAATLPVPAGPSRFGEADSHGTSTPLAGERIETHSKLHVVNEMIAYASSSDAWSRFRETRGQFWRAKSKDVAQAFTFNRPPFNAQDSHELDYFIDLYMEHFSPLWPLLTRQNLHYASLHPLLYLVLTSIGAMYAGKPESGYATMMHTQIRKSLSQPWEIESPSSDDLLWLGQARLLTQVAALYFGQVKAFSVAQHLGALLLAQARRMNLFAETPNPLFSAAGVTTPRSDAETFLLWLYHESRRRLSLGIVRADTFTSVLLSTKPLVTLEEVDVQPPACDAVWAAQEQMSPQVCLQLIRQDHTPGRNMKLSDIYRIATDRQEALPVLGPSAFEFLMFGLHGQVWRFSRDSQVMERLCGNESNASSSLSQLNSGRPPLSIFGADSLDGPQRQMKDYKSDQERLISALEAWKSMLPHIRTLAQTRSDRSRLLSSLLLYHLTYIGLLAPVADFHLIQYQLVDKRAVEEKLVASIRTWAQTPEARVAAEHACTVWSLIHTECQRAESLRAKFNFLAFTGLHHSGIVLWCFAGAVNPSSPVSESACLRLVSDGHDGHGDIPIDHGHSQALLESFVRLYDRISPTRWSQFAKAALAVSKYPFPSRGN